SKIDFVSPGFSVMLFVEIFISSSYEISFRMLLPDWLQKSTAFSNASFSPVLNCLGKDSSTCSVSLYCICINCILPLKTILQDSLKEWANSSNSHQFHFPPQVFEMETHFLRTDQ